MKTYFELIKESKTPEEMHTYLLEYEMFCISNHQVMEEGDRLDWLNSERSFDKILRDVVKLGLEVMMNEDEE